MFFDWSLWDGGEYDSERGYEIIDEFLGEYAQQMLDYERAPKAINPFRFADIQRTQRTLEKLFGDNGKVSCKLEPHRGVGTVYVEATEMVFPDPKVLLAVVNLANNMEVYPLTNGRCRMALSFYGLSEQIGG